MRQSAVHGIYEDEQLTTIQKRICLIEFLFMVGLLFVEDAAAPTTVNKMLFVAFFVWNTSFWRVRKFVLEFLCRY